MKSTRTLVAAAGMIACLHASAETPASSSNTTNPLTERGRYLVHQAGMCIDCHSPRDEKGVFIDAKHLTGAPIGFKPTVPMPWMPVAPRLAGLPAGFTRTDMIHYLMTGKRPNGTPTLPPMPTYRFNREDAESITDYLQNFKIPKP